MNVNKTENVNIKRIKNVNKIRDINVNMKIKKEILMLMIIKN